MSTVPTSRPELIVGIAGPIGVDIDGIIAELNAAFGNVGYRPQLIRLTEEMAAFPVEQTIEDRDFFQEAMSKMRYGNAVCGKFGDPAALARIGIQAIRLRRAALTGDENTIASGVAFVIRQLKRPEEVALLRRVYGPHFLLVSAYGAREQRRELLLERLRQTMPTKTHNAERIARAEELIETDAEERDRLGQRLRDTFHRGDVFIDGLSRQDMRSALFRFVDAFFGRADIGPYKDEFGMFMASATALRSSDLSRQVGAAIFTPDGELIAQGCNEAPRASGGAYWDSDGPDFRDVKLGHDPNAREVREVLRDLFERLDSEKLLSDLARSHGSPGQMVEALFGTQGVLAEAAIRDLTEYGRVVHAEMHAICEAARLGRSIRNATLFSTTFPCHNCTKHIIAAGIRRVVYIEPYPKSRAAQLHAHEVRVESDSALHVSFMPFLGIAPNRYRDIFQKGRRKDGGGSAKQWYHDQPTPMIESNYPGYLVPEQYELRPLLLGSV